MAEVSFAVLGAEEKCAGESARRMGDKCLFQEFATTNLDTLKKYNVRKIIAHCPHCVNSFLQDYPQMGGEYEVVHHNQLIATLVQQGKLPVNSTCCGGGRLWFDDAPSERSGAERVEEIPETGAETVAVSFPFCMAMLSDGIASSAESSKVRVRDVAESLVDLITENPLPGANDS